MTQDTRRDRVWNAILQLGADPPTYRLEYSYSENSPVTGFTKADVRLAVDGEVGARTVHDVIQTAISYGVVHMVKEPAHASVREHPITGEQSQMDVYALTDAWGSV